MRTKPGTGIEEYDALPGPSLLKRTLGLQNLHHTYYLGPNEIPDPYNPHRLDAASIDRKSKTNDQEIVVRLVHPSHAFRMVPDAGTDEYAREQSLTDEIEATVGKCGSQLV